MQNQVKEFAKLNGDLKIMEKTLRHAMDKVEAPKQKVKSEDGFINVVSQAEVVDVFDDQGEKSLTSESFYKYYQNSLTPSSGKNDVSKYAQIDNPDGYKCIGAYAKKNKNSIVIINLKFKYLLNECVFYVQTGMASHVSLSLLEDSAYDPSKTKGWL